MLAVYARPPHEPWGCLDIRFSINKSTTKHNNCNDECNHNVMRQTVISEIITGIPGSSKRGFRRPAVESVRGRGTSSHTHCRGSHTRSQPPHVGSSSDYDAVRPHPVSAAHTWLWLPTCTIVSHSFFSCMISNQLNEQNNRCTEVCFLHGHPRLATSWHGPEIKKQLKARWSRQSHCGPVPVSTTNRSR